MGYIIFKNYRDDSYGNVTNSNSSDNFIQIWAENFQCFAIDADGNLYSWGLNDVKIKLSLVLPIRKWIF